MDHPGASPEERALLERFIDAHERCDTAAAAVEVAAAGIRVTMPPAPFVFDGLEAVRTLMARAFGPEREGEWRLLPTMANRMPAAASYLLQPDDMKYRPYKLDVMRVAGGQIAEVTTFGPHLFGAFGLPPTLGATGLTAARPA